ncbi:hypothetical protein OAD06_03325 [Flavobacteriaceae bacterium]|nr:hypothetical protein [Flavobacteriaceae bacterium]MDB9913311.1 hypothetical protein [Flavobacteriaceae bacterium]MDB9993685.1 hypothetical protein [Flavobacteriaceae bacterium]
MIFSILAPTVFNLCSETDTIVLLDSTEEEKSEKTEKDIEEKIINYYTLNDKSLSFLKKRTAQLIYLESNIDYTLKVLLPPPEQHI